MAGVVRVELVRRTALGELVPVGNEFVLGSEIGVSVLSEGQIDAFGRQRVSAPETIFDSKQLFDNSPLLWDDQEVSGGGTGTTYTQNRASTSISVGDTTAGKRIRQSFRSFNYEPGKSQLIFMTFTGMGGAAGIVKEVGLGNDGNGVFFVNDEGTLKMRIRSSVGGVATNTDVEQSAWSDPLDGTGDSGFTIDPSKSNILFIDLEWLGVGRVRTGFVIDGLIVPVHAFNNANNLDSVYMSTPNLPLRYSIENDGTGAADSLEHICSSVISEGGTQSVGKTAYLPSDGEVNANTEAVIYALKGVRLKTGGVGATVRVESVSVQATTNDPFEWLLILNPTVAGSPSWADVSNFAIQEGSPDTTGSPSATTVTGGTIISGGLGSGDGGGGISDIQAISDTVSLGADIAGSVDELWLCVTPHSANLDIRGALKIRELA